MRKVLAIVLAVFVVACLPLVGQTQFGTVVGRVADATGAIVPNAKVMLANLATNVRQETDTNAEGLYVFANLPAGDYEVSLEQAGFRKAVRRIALPVAQRVVVDFDLEIGQVTEQVVVTDIAVPINTANGELSRQISRVELENLPLLTRNPYNLVALAPGAADTAAVTGDTRGVGLSVAGARTSSVNFMLDGGENNETFLAGVGQEIPLDAVQEFRVQTNAMTAEFGRNLIVTNVITKSGTNRFHGSAYEYYRGAGLSSTPFDDNASGTGKSNFVRNLFGASAGGPISRDKTFFFASFEGLRVRSSAAKHFFVPTQDFINAASDSTRAFINAFGGLPQSDPGNFLTAADILEIEESSTALRNARTGAVIPGGTPLFARATVRAPTDAGGGNPQNTWLGVGRFDHNFSDRTTLRLRYAVERSDELAGSVSVSPYQGFNTGENISNHNVNLTLTNTFSPRVFSESRVVFNRLFDLQPLGEAPGTTPCWQYDFNAATPTGDIITFPGYLPEQCAFAGIPFGGPQNIYQFFEGVTVSRGKHTIKGGAQYLHMRDNRTFGAYENGWFDTFDMQGMLDGRVDLIFLAMDPKGKVPGDVYRTSTDGPFQPPSFTRHFRYNEFALYAEDSVKLTPRFTLTAGLRWEYFGVLHSPNHERHLDANLFLDAVGTAGADKSIFARVRDARFQRTTHLYKQDFNNFAPRVGFAWDPFGNSRTVFRGGYGLFYDRNFGNALFNVIQNPPNYAVLTLTPETGAPIRPNQFDTVTALGGGSLTISSSARMLNPEMDTAHSAQWNATVEHDFFGKGLIGSVSYVGVNGYKLYSLNNLNPRGSCLRDPSIVATCNPAGGNNSRLNQTGLTGMNRRGNEGLSRYHGLSTEFKARRIGDTGVTFATSYTWSHAIDNESSFFSDSAFEGPFGFGFRDPYNPALDRASSSNDIRHRYTASFTWALPGQNLRGAAGAVIGGWNLSGIYVAQTGGAFSVYDVSNSQCNTDATNFCYPVIRGSTPSMTDAPGRGPNTFVLYDLSGTFQSQEAFCGGDLACTARLNQLQPHLLSPRNLFRTPGFWNWDMALLKNFNLPPEGMKLQFRAEFFNLPNHSNLYVQQGSNSFTGAASRVLGARGVPPAFDFGLQAKERRNIQLALRLTW